FPDAQLNRPAINDADEDDIRTLGKLFMGLNRLADPAPFEFLEVVNKNAAVRIPHLQRSNRERLAFKLEFIVDDFFHRLAGRHGNRFGVKLWLAEFGIKQVIAGLSL